MLQECVGPVCVPGIRIKCCEGRGCAADMLLVPNAYEGMAVRP